MPVLSFVSKALVVFALSFALTGCYKSSEERAAEHFESGLKLVEEGDLPRAIVEFRNTLKFDEDNLEAYRQMARANIALDEVPAAYAGFLRVVEQAPDDVEGRVALSEIAFVEQSWEEFDRHSAHLAALAVDEPAVNAVLVGADYRQALQAQDTPRRYALITQAEELAKDLPGHPILQRIRIDTYIAQGAYQTALATIDDGIAHDPEDLDHYAIKLALLGRLDDQAQLEETLLVMLDRFPENLTAKETYLSYLLARDRQQDAEAFLERLLAEATPENADGTFFSLINFLRQTQGPEAALTRIDAALAADPAQDQTRQTLRATLLFEMGQRDDGIAAMREILDPETVALEGDALWNAETALAQMLLANGDEAGARAMIDEVLSQNASQPSALKMRSVWLIAQDDTTAAINDLRLVLDRNPDDADAMVLMSDAYGRAGNKELKQNFLARATEISNSAPRYALLQARALIEDSKFLQAETVLISSLRIVPGHVEILKTLGQVYLNLDDLPRTQHVAETLEKIEVDQAQAAAQALQIELVARRLGVDEALQFLEQQTAQNGDASSVALTLIQARLKTGRVEDALRTATDAVAENPDDPRLRNALALSYAVARDYPAAEAEFMILLESYPQVANVYLQLARINAAQGDYAQGAEIVARGLTALPDAPDLLWAKASYLEQDGDIAGAIEIYETLYARNSDGPIVANNLASLLAAHRDDPESLQRAETIARRLNGTTVPAFQDTYGYVQFRRGNLQEALAYLEPAAAGLPNDPQVQFHLGEVYAGLARSDDALNQMRRALDIAGPLATAEFREKVNAQIAQIELARTDN
jgi:tetratricopeptide (TPR) repeat protein